VRAWLRRLWWLAPIGVIAALLAIRASSAVAPRSRLAADGTGSVYLARGGPLIIGFSSPSAAARLEIAGHEMHGRGQVVMRYILPRGALPIAFEGPPDARLVWSPPGRRGDPEYLPASSLSPLPPDRATFADDAGTNRVDGMIALAILIVLAATALIVARAKLAACPRAIRIAVLAVLVGGVGVRWLDLSAAGQTWDEDVYWAAGKNAVQNVLALDARQADWRANFEHPPVTKLLDGIGAELADGYGPARALSAIWIALGCALLVPIGARLYGTRAGILAGAIATLLPPLIAHGKIVGHESPSVLWWTLGVLLALGVHDRLPAVPDRAGMRTLCWRLVGCGVVLGLALGTRFVNGLLGPLLGVLVLLRAPEPWRMATLRWGAAIMPVIAVATLVAIWPRLWSEPLHHLAESWDKLKTSHSPEPFLGTLTNQPGPYYFVVYLFATAPAGILLGAGAWIWRTLRDPASRRSAWVIAAWFVIPLGVMASPVRQDGVRYVMPCVTVLAVVAGAGFDALASWLAGRFARAFTAVAILVGAYLLIVDARIHPYYLDYFGEQVGGPRTVDRYNLFETAWWGEGVDRAVDYVNAHAAAGDVVFRNCIEPAHLAWFREDLWTPMTNAASHASWIVTYAPLTHGCPMPAGMQRVFSVSAQGAPLAEVWHREP
jgi:4-amino-4-deoxy-L-arabinose transferase-like glycosyltransferase